MHHVTSFSQRGVHVYNRKTYRMNTHARISTLSVLLALLLGCKGTPDSADPSLTSEIQPGKDLPAYWHLNGEPVMLLGGSVQDNLFQVDGLTEHLELLGSVGGNYVRCTMSSRDEGNLWPFLKNEEGLYDLNRPDPAYWERFRNFLDETSERAIIVQVEVWATFDFYRENWDVNPFNPANNINYDERRSKLPVEVKTHPIFTENNFFRSVPSQMCLPVVLEYQQKFVDQLVAISLDYDNVLYCMDNETSVTSDWGKFWASYIQKKAEEKGKKVFTTEMWDPWDLGHPLHAETFDNPEVFNFVDISQNNHQVGDAHWFNGLARLKHLSDREMVRPVNNVKVYGNDGGRHKTTRNGIENFIQNVLMGCAGTRFHRPTSGQGLNANAQAVIRSMRMLVDEAAFFQGSANLDVLVDRVAGQQYCRATPGKEYIVYFTREGAVGLDLSAYKGNFSIRWLDVMQSQWSDGGSFSGGSVARLQTPGEGDWIGLLTLAGPSGR